MEVQLFKTQSRMELHCDETYHLHASQKIKYNFLTVKYLLSCSMSMVLTVKVEGLIRPPLAQTASTKACYKLGLSLVS